MSKTIIAFFSSDAREKYKADVFRVLALPPKYGIHFRYQTAWLHPTVRSKLDSLINKEGVIFYAKGNNPKVDQAKRKITIHSIRNVVIKDIYEDKHNGIVNFYLELNGFSDCQPDKNTPKDFLPPYGIVSEISVTEGNDDTWKGRISVVEKDFKNTLFYYISSIGNDDNEIQPKYSYKKKKWYYELDDESAYQVEFSFYDPSDGVNGITVENSDDLVLLDIPPEYKLGAPRETEFFNLYTQSLSKPKSDSFSRISIKTADNSKSETPQVDLSVQLNWDIIRTFAKIARFGFLSALAAIGILCASIAFKDLTKASFAPWNWIIAVISLLCIGVSASFLFMWFNKK